MPAGYAPEVGVRNFLIEGRSGTGKTSVCRELQRRGYHAINGDTDLAYQGDPVTGVPTELASHWHHLWRVDDVRRLAADLSTPVTFFCGGSRNFPSFLHLFDGVFVLEVDRETLIRRLEERSPDEFGGREAERDLVLRLHGSEEDTPTGAISIDATAPLTQVVDEILQRASVLDRRDGDQ